MILKHLKKFDTDNLYQDFKSGEDFIRPNVSLIVDINYVDYNQNIPPSLFKLCDVVYFNGTSICSISNDKFNSSLGTPIGVVVIPKGVLPDGKARIVSLKPVDSDGNESNTYFGNKWGVYGVDTELTNYQVAPYTGPDNSSIAGFQTTATFPSDYFTGIQSYSDPKSKYHESFTNKLAPSPYLNDDSTLNPLYNANFSDYVTNTNGDINVLTDFNGLHNTQILVNLGEEYIAANAAWKYKDGVSGLQWYLPSGGELGFLMARLKQIDNVISSLGGLTIFNSTFNSTTSYMASSNEIDSEMFYMLNLERGVMGPLRGNKKLTCVVYPFAVIE